MTWGTSIAAFVQQSFMEAIIQYLQPDTNANYYVYIDDFSITGDSMAEVNHALELLQNYLRKAGFEVN